MRAEGEGMSRDASRGTVERRAIALVAGLLLVVSAGCAKPSPTPQAPAADEHAPVAATADVPAAGPADTAVRPGIDIVGFDLGRAEGEIADASACQRACDARDACKAWTLSLTDGACWLKSGVGELYDTDFAVSGVKRGESWPAGTP